MQVRVNTNWSFKRVTRVTRAWLRFCLCLANAANLAANKPFKRAKILNAEKKGGVGSPPKVHLT